MNEEKPAPLVPPEVQLRGYGYMPLFGDRLFKSETWISGSAEAKVAMLRLWWHAYAHEEPASSLPDNDALLADYAGYGVAIKAWRKVKDQAMRGFVLSSDGRWHHPFLATLAIDGWERRLNSDETNEAKQTRQQRWRDRCKLLSQQLRDAGITPPRGASLETLERLLKDRGLTPSTSPQTSPIVDAEIGKKGTERNREERKESKDSTTSTPAKPDVRTLIALGADEQHAKDWIAVRKAKHAPLTDTAIKGMQREAEKAGITFAQAVAICADRSWQGFNASWNWQGTPNSTGAGMSKQAQLEERNRQVTENWTPAEETHAGR